MILKAYSWIFNKELGDFFCDDVVRLGRETTKKRASVGRESIFQIQKYVNLMFVFYLIIGLKNGLIIFFI